MDDIGDLYEIKDLYDFLINTRPPSMTGRIVNISTPSSKSHDWIKDYFMASAETTEKPPYVPEPFRGSASIWVTGNGRRIPVSELSTPHLINILDKLKETATKHIQLDTRSVVAERSAYGWWRIQDQWLREYCPTYSRLKHEALARGVMTYNLILKKLDKKPKVDESKQLILKELSEVKYKLGMIEAKLFNV